MDKKTALLIRANKILEEANAELAKGNRREFWRLYDEFEKKYQEYLDCK